MNDDKEKVRRLRDEVSDVLIKLDDLAEVWGDEGVFRRCRDQLRELLQSTGDNDADAVAKVGDRR